MKIPQKPKPFNELVQAAVKAKRLAVVFSNAQRAGIGKEYLHWDELRRRPAPAGFSHDEWWLGVKLSRAGSRRALPLKDKNGQPFAFSVPDRMTEQLHHIDRGSGAIVPMTETLANPRTRDRYLVRSLIEESITSSQLEGAATTREVAKEMLTTGRKPRDRSEQMILNNYRTMQHIREIKDQALTPELVLDLHRRVTEDTLDKPDAAGRLRRADEPVHVADMEGRIYHTPPAAAELPGRLEAMCSFANGQTPDYFIHPVVRAVILHFWLAYDHPFVDGNGRTARALFYWAMLHQGFWLFEFISISQILLKAPAQYALFFLYTETDDNDVTYFLLHQSDVIRRSLEVLHEYIQHKTREVEAVSHLLHRMTDVSLRQQNLLAHALRHPGYIYTVAGHRLRHHTAYDTARKDLLRLAKKGLLEKRKRGREWIFLAPRDLSRSLRTA